jgi:hypothetical protein
MRNALDPLEAQGAAPMRNMGLPVGPFLVLVFTAIAAPAAAPKALEPLRFLLGDWQAQGAGKPGEGTGGFTFALALQDRVLVRTNYADYLARAERPSSRHDDLMVLYATDAGEIRADYYDSEGHVIRYSGTTRASGQLILVSEPAAGAPRFRLSYRLNPDGTLDGRFEIAPPGEPDSFGPFLSWTSRRTSAKDTRSR